MLCGLDISMGIASSLVDMNTATRVPIEISRPAKRLEATTENPHCGIAPRTAPPTDPKGPILRSAFPNFSEERCSMYSINIYTPNKKGNTFKVSNSASIKNIQ